MSDRNGSSPKLDATGATPNFTVNDLSKTVAFYTEGLGFEVQEEHAHEGSVVYVVLRAGTVLLGFGQDDFAKGKDRAKGVGFRLWISTEQELEVLAARARAAGIALDTEPEDLPWGGRAFAVTDPDGFKISIASS